MELLKNTIPRYRNCGIRSEAFTESGDAIVSDVNPDVMNIVNTEANLVIREKTLLAGSVKITGEIQAQIYYQAYENEELFVTAAKFPFTHLCDMECGEQDLAVAEVTLLSIQANMLNPRKVNCRAELSLQLELFRPEQYRYLEGIRGGAEEKIQVRSHTVEELVLAGVAQKRVTLADEIRLSGTEMPEGSRILRWDVTWTTEETRVLSKKVMVRGVARIDLTTLSPNGSFVTRAGYPASFSQIVECEEAEVGDRLELRYLPMNTQVRLITKPDGSAALDYDITAEITAMALRHVEYPVLEDVYSTRFEMEVEPCISLLEGEPCPQLLEKPVSETIVTGSPAVRVQDICIKAMAACACCGDASLQAEYYVKVLYETSEGMICAACKRISVEIPAAQACACGCVYTPCADGASGSVDQDGAIRISFRAQLNLSGRSSRETRLVQNCRLDPEKPKQNRRRGSLVLRNVCDGEDVWSIAKAYNTAPDDICSANKLERGTGLEVGRLLIIPFVG